MLQEGCHFHENGKIIGCVNKQDFLDDNMDKNKRKYFLDQIVYLLLI